MLFYVKFATICPENYCFMEYKDRERVATGLALKSAFAAVGDYMNSGLTEEKAMERTIQDRRLNKPRFMGEIISALNPSIIFRDTNN